jgi:hypothetical protein
MRGAPINTETPLLRHITAAMETVKSSLADILSKADDDERQRFEEDIAKFKAREVLFYDTVLSQLTERFGPFNSEEFYLYFDIDETIAHRTPEWEGQAEEEIRPSLQILLQDIKSAYPNVHFGICSSRAQRFIDEFIQTYSEFGFEV